MMNNINNLFDSLDVLSTNELLENIDYIEAPAGAKKRIMRLVYKKTGMRGKARRQYWLIPAAAVIAAVITIALIPEARAAVADLINRMFSVPGYMAQDTADRPAISELDAIIQTPIPTTVATDGEKNLPVAVFTDVSDDAQFLNNVNVKVTETLYDGKSLIIMAELTGDIQNLYDEETGFILPGIKGGYGFKPSELTFTDKDGKTQKVKAFAGFLAPNLYSEKYKGGVNNSSIILDSLKMAIATDTRNLLALSGLQDVNIPLTVYKTIKIDANSGKSVPIGTCTLSYSFDPTAGNESFKTVNPDKTIDLKGEALISEVTQRSGYMMVKNTSLPLDECQLKLIEVSKSPLGITIKILYKCAYNWTDLQKTALLGGLGYGLDFHVILNGQEYSSFGKTFGQYDKTWSYAELDLRIIGSNQKSIETLEILPVISYLTEVNGVKITSSQQKISVKDNGEEGGWSQEQGLTALINCKIPIELP